MPQNVKSRSIKQPSIRGVQTLVVFLCSRSFCRRPTTPFCHSSAPKLIKCNILYPRIKRIEDSLYCKEITTSMAIGCDPPSHFQTLGVYVATLTWPSVGVKPNTWKELGFGVLRDSRMFRARQQGAKHLALGCSWCH
jgi:hypothetical protein